MKNLKHLIIIGTLSLVTSLTFGQTQTLTFPKSSVQMELPAGYETSTENGFSGLVNAKEGNQFVITAIPMPYSEMKKQLTPQALETTGVIVTDSEPYITNSMPGTLYTASQTEGDVTMNKYILLFGNDSNSYMIMAVYNKATPSSEILGYLDTIKLN